MVSKTPVRVALIGASNRSKKVYGPLLKGLVVAVWSRSESSAEELGKMLGTPWYTDLEKLVQV